MSMSPVRMKVQLEACPELTSEANLFRSDKELIEYKFPAVRVLTLPIAIAASALDCVITVKNDVCIGFVVTPICIWDKIPPIIASSAYNPLSLSRYNIPLDIYEFIPLLFKNAKSSLMRE